MNVILLTADSLAASYFKPESSDISEKINGVEFTNAITTAADTASAMPGLAAGIMCDDVEGIGLPTQGPPIPVAEIYQKEGYNTALWTDNDLFGPNYNYDRGFKDGNLGSAGLKKKIGNHLAPQQAGELNDPETESKGFKSNIFRTAEKAYFDVYKQFREKIGYEEHFYRNAGSLSESALNWLREREGEDNFLWIHYMDTHHPYEPPTDYFSELELNYDWSRSEMSLFSRRVIKSNNVGISSEKMEDIRKVYSACCTYLYDEISGFLNQALSEEIISLNRDIIAVTADHGECLKPENEMLGHVPPAFWEDIIHVPLIVARPDWEQGHYGGQVSTINLMPTLLTGSKVQPPTTTRKSGANVPEDMMTETTVFASKRLLPGQKTRVYQGARSQDDLKVFGCHLHGTDFEIGTKIEDGLEKVIFKGRNGDIQNRSSSEQDFERLFSSLGDRGGLVDTHSDTINNEDHVREHLQDLGYLD